MMHLLTPESLTELTSGHARPCLSLYQATHRHRPDNQQDPVRFHNLVKALESSLRQQHSAGQTRSLLEPLEMLAKDHDFWNHARDALTVLRAADFFRVYCLQRAMLELAVVAGSFHTKPLRRYLQSVDRYQVLGLSRARVRLFEGNRSSLDEIDPAKGVPRTIAEALGSKLTEPHQTVASYGGVGGTKGPMHHGHGGRKDETDLDAERFFRAVDRAVLEHHSRITGLPLVLAALPEHRHLFRSLSHNPFLMEAGLAANPDGMPIEELRQRVWEIVEPRHQAREVAMVDACAKAKSHGRGSDGLAEVAEASAAGRVATLLIESGRQIAGRLDGTTGRIETGDLNDPQVDDLLDDLGELVERMGGEVHVLRIERMPRHTGFAATFRN